MLSWNEDYPGIWQAKSAAGAGGFQWEIRGPRGSRVWYVLNGSAALMAADPTTKHDTLQQAQEEAERVEDLLLGGGESGR